MLSFGTCPLNVTIWDRAAAYVVVRDGAAVATVRPNEKHFLPGGGSQANESAEDTIRREVREELGRELGPLQRIGEAFQYFYSGDDDRHYRMHAHFFSAAFIGPGDAQTENDLHWLPAAATATSFFHECHWWAIRETL